MQNKPKRILGLDYGLKRIGLALSDERQIIASPLVTFHAEEKTEKTVSKFIFFIKELQEKGNYEIEKMVVGYPLMMNAKPGFLADETKHFVSLLEKEMTIPIILWDERLTSVQAERSLRESTMTRKKRTKVVDIISAAIILQNYLDSKTIQRNLETP